jgi:rod shape-determining protein MreC
VAALVLVSLVLLTVYLREDDEGALHASQRIGLAILAPFEVAGEKIARPFQDAYAYVSGLTHAKAERDRLERRVQELTEQLARSQAAVEENDRLREALGYVGGARFPEDFRAITTHVIAQPSGPYRQELLIAAGTGEGVTKDAPVVTPDGLVGRVSQVSSSGSKVTLLTDQSMAVSAYDVATQARGLVQPSPSAGSSLILSRVAKEQVVNDGDTVVTSGWRTGDLSSLYPQGIPIGTVTSVGIQDIDLYQRIQVTPFVDFDSLTEVIVLVRE